MSASPDGAGLSGRPTPRSARPGATTARAVALEALARIDQGAYANLVLPALLARAGLGPRDRRLATELTYGTTRMRRACDHLIDRFLRAPVEEPVRRVLRLGAYQLQYLNVPDHAAVSSSVELAPRRARGLVNAVLRKVAFSGSGEWPDEATRLSYPDWVLDRLRVDLGPEGAGAALEQMNRAPAVTRRGDGYVQDLASQWVGRYAAPPSGALAADLCAGPGGKTTLLAGPAALVAALDIHPARARLVRDNSRSLGWPGVAAVVADGARPPLRPATLGCVLVDAPCSGLGVLRRRPDARWRLDPDAPHRLAALQRRLLAAGAALLSPGGRLFYSVCTMTSAETLEVDAWAAAALPGLEALPGPGAPWRAHGRGSLLLPQDADTDGMYVLGLARPLR